MGCYSASWDRSQTNDVPYTIQGVEQCESYCKAANFKYFGFECPMAASGNVTSLVLYSPINRKQNFEFSLC